MEPFDEEMQPQSCPRRLKLFYKANIHGPENEKLEKLAGKILPWCHGVHGVGGKETTESIQMLAKIWIAFIETLFGW